MTEKELRELKQLRHDIFGHINDFLDHIAVDDYKNVKIQFRLNGGYWNDPPAVEVSVTHDEEERPYEYDKKLSRIFRNLMEDWVELETFG
jgi:hypothetical protein